MLGLPSDYLRTYRDQVAAVTRADVRRVAEQHVTPDQAVIVIVGDAVSIMNDVRQFSEDVELFDSNGNRKSEPGSEAATNVVDFAGSWSLSLKLPTGQNVPATMQIESSPTGLQGSVKSQFGDAEISKVVLDGQNLQGELSIALMGQQTRAEVAVVITGDSIKGSLVVPGFPQINLEGSRS